MFYVFLAFVCICFYGAKFSGKGYHEDYMSPKSTTAVNGFFVFLVFMNHFAQYYPLTTVYDAPYRAMSRYLGQLIVVTFLFYSGYGMFESFKKKGIRYFQQIPTKRFLKVLLHLDIVVVLYCIMNLCLGRHFGWKQILLSFVAWDGIGNSNWYIFTVLVLYIFVYFGFMLFQKHPVPALILVTILATIYVFYMPLVKERYWSNTALCLPLGMWYSLLKPYIDKVIKKSNFIYLGALLLCVSAIIFGHNHYVHKSMYTLMTFGFAGGIALLTMKFKMDNKVLNWLGSHVFSVYMLQRIPMLVLQRFTYFAETRYACFFASLVLTVLMAEVFDRAIGALDKKIFAPRKKAVA